MGALQVMFEAMEEVQLVTASPEETRLLGQRLGKAAVPGDVFLLQGSFGAGKTVLVQGLAEGLGIDEPVSSPSYVIMTQHRGGRLLLYHVDLYRVEHIETALLEELEEDMADEAVTAVEWSERLPGILRQGATVIRLEPLDEQRRSIEVQTSHERLADAARS